MSTSNGLAVRPAAAVVLVLLAVVTSGCMTRTIRTPVFEENFSEVYLRHRERGGKPVDRGFSHPVEIAPVRMTNIISRIEVRKGGDKDREPAIATEMLYEIGEGIARTLAKADSSQEVVVMARQRKRNLAVFTQDYLTSMVVWAQGEKIYIKLGALDEPLSKNPNDKPKEPAVDKIVGKTRAVPADGISVEGEQLVAVHWRDPLFQDVGALHVRPGGQVVRRTVLMDSGPESTLPADPQVGAAVPPQGLSPDALRALADLEEQRRRGEVTEADYQAQRRQILSSDLPAAEAQPAAEPAGPE